MDRRSLPGVLSLAAFALGVRALAYRRAFHKGHVFFFGNDSWYHMRRVEFAVRHDLRLPGLDPYLSFPDGGATLWGGLFDRLAAAAAVLSGAAYRGRHALESFCAWVPAVLGGLCAVPAFLLGGRFFGPREGVLAALFLAVLPGHVQYSLLGNFDHHVLESLLFGCATVALLRLRDDSPRPLLRESLLAGGVLWLLFLTHPALSSVYVGVIWSAVMSERRFPREAAWAFFLPALLLLPWAVASLQPMPGVSRLGTAPAWLMYEQHSFLQPLLLGFCGSSLLAWRGIREKAPAARIVGWALATGVLLAVLLWPLASGAGELFKHDPWLKYIAETQPILSPSPVKHFDPSFAFQTFGYWFLAFPVWWAWDWRRRGDPFLAAWSAALFILVNIQLRFMPVFAYAQALALASAAVAAWDKAASSKRNAGAARAAMAALLLAGLWPSGAWLWALAKGSRYKYLTISDQVYEMLSALKDSSPATSGYDDADRKPEYAVLAPWDFGHAVVYLARRAVVADPFGHGVRRSYGYYAAATPQEARARLDGVRYVMGQDLSDPLTHRIHADYLKPPAGHPLLTGDWRSLFHMKLLLDVPMKDAAGRLTTWGHRLVYRSEDGRESLYEYDKGGP